MNLEQHNHPLIMGILNVTPDSFSDGGDFSDPEAAIAHAMQMVEDGADLIDIGGESTRPGSQRISPREQQQRIIPVITALAKRLPTHISISIDTTSSAVASSALDAGAAMINDISAGEEDSSMFPLAAARGVPIILMHKQGIPESMQNNPEYVDVVTDVCSYLQQQAARGLQAGIEKVKIILDPGIGFGKTMQHNLQLIAHLDVLTATGHPVLLGASRKSLLASICQVENNKELTGATCATTVAGVLAGVRIFRVHDVKENRQAADVAFAVRESDRSS